MIKVTDLCKSYGNTIALDMVSFEVKKGHIYGLLGPNGAGKSTTMNIITGYIAPTLGEVSVNNHILGKETNQAKKCIGYLPENPPLYPDMLVREFLQFVAAIKKVPKKSRLEEVENAIKKTGLSDVSGRLIKNLSKGYKQRVGIAQAIIGNPEIIILDEPTVGLDPKQIIEIRELIRSFKKDHTVILSSHILSEIAAVCDDVLIIAHGRVVACDTTDNLLKETGAARVFTVTVKGSKDKTKNVLSKLNKIVKNLQFISEEKDKVTFRFETTRRDDIREDISFALSDARLLILSLNEEQNSLEDIYLTLIDDADRKFAEEMARRKLEEEKEDEDDDSDEEEDSKDDSSKDSESEDKESEADEEEEKESSGDEKDADDSEESDAEKEAK